MASSCKRNDVFDDLMLCCKCRLRVFKQNFTKISGGDLRNYDSMTLMVLTLAHSARAV